MLTQPVIVEFVARLDDKEPNTLTKLRTPMTAFHDEWRNGGSLKPLRNSRFVYSDLMVGRARQGCVQ